MPTCSTHTVVIARVIARLAAGAAHAAAALPGAAGQPHSGDGRRAAQLAGLRGEPARS